MHHSNIDHRWEPMIQCDALGLSKSVIADANKIQMPTLQVHVFAKNAGVGVRQWAAETMQIWQDKGGLTTQQIDSKVRECVREIAQSLSIINKQGAGPEHGDLLIDHCVTPISDLASNRPLWKWYIADKTSLNGQKLKATLEQFTKGGLGWRKNGLNITTTKIWKLVHISMYFIAPKLHSVFPMMCRYRWRPGRNFQSQVFADEGVLAPRDWIPRGSILLYHCLCGSRHCWEEDGWKRHSAMLKALAWGWWMYTTDGYINRRYDHCVNGESCNRPSARPQPDNPSG